LSYEALMQGAIDLALGGGNTHTAVVNLLWGNVIGGVPADDVLANYVGMLDSGAHTAGSLGVLAANTDFNANNINLAGLAETGIEYN
jgi:hypothetical protein